jgi:hypothetical protein
MITSPSASDQQHVLMRRLWNPGTAAGLMLGPLIAFLVVLAARSGDVDDVWPPLLGYFVISYAPFFLAFRLLPYRGLRAALWALPVAVVAAWLGFWWGGLGVAAALLLALALPNR